MAPLLDIVSWDGSRLHKLLARLQGSKMGSGPSNKSIGHGSIASVVAVQTTDESHLFNLQ